MLDWSSTTPFDLQGGHLEPFHFAKDQRVRQHVDVVGPSDIQGLHPRDALQPGRFDATVLLLLWCLRKTSYPLLWIGIIGAMITGRFNENLVADLDTVGEILRAVLSPLVGIALALMVRVLVGILGFALAYPLSRSNTSTDYAHGRRTRNSIRLWQDRLHLTRAYRSLRWTWIVRAEAVTRLGDTGRRLALCDPVLRWLGAALFIVLVSVLWTSV